MLAEYPVCRACFVTARSVAAKCYGLVNLYDRIAGCGQARCPRGASFAVKTAPTTGGRTSIAVRPATQDTPFGHGARCPTKSRARRPAETALDWCAGLLGGLFWCGRECATRYQT